MDYIRNIFKKINSVSKKTKTPIYVVGGFVRDFLMGVEQKKDIDFVVEGGGLSFAKDFDKAMEGKGSLVEFPDFDTARYILKSEIRNPYFLTEGKQSETGKSDEEIVIEFAGARSEKYDPKSRKPKIENATLEEDLSRRDFTVNAMAIAVEEFAKNKPPLLPLLRKEGTACPPLKKGRCPQGTEGSKLVDPHDGLKDLRDKVLRTPLDPKKTFSDDPLRMMRAIRFSAQLGFCIEKNTLEAIFTEKERLKIVSAERVQEELFKLLSTPKPSIGLSLLFQTHLLDYILPEVSKLDGVEEVYGHQHKNNLVHTFKVVDNISTRSDKVLLRLAALLHDIGKYTTKKFVPKIGWTFYQHEHVGKKLVFGIGARLRLAKADTDYLAKLVRWHQQPISLMDEGITDSAVRRLIVNLGEELEDLLLLGRSDITTGNPFKKEKRLKNYDRLEKRIAEVLAKDKLRAFQSPFRGDEIMKEAGLKAGPTVGKIKKAIEEAILDGKIPNEHGPAEKYFAEIKDEYLKKAEKWERV